MEIIKKGECKYPTLLDKIKNAPKELYVEGDTDCFDMPSITIIGSRNMTEYGRDMTRIIVSELAKSKMCIVSGLAVGIDSVAHQSCLDNGGKTIAVIGSGLNKIYPTVNKGLYKKIIENGGCVISEYEPDTEAKKAFFPARNRIVSGLSLGTLVIEATYRSGTSITAKLAFEQGRKVFCLPNKIGSKNSAGTINLIKRGAIMVTSANEILYELGIIDRIENYEKSIEEKRINKIKLIEQQKLSNMDKHAKKIYLYIKENKIVNSEVISNQLKVNIQEVNIYLTILELAGLISYKQGNDYVIRDEFDV